MSVYPSSVPMTSPRTGGTGATLLGDGAAASDAFAEQDLHGQKDGGIGKEDVKIDLAPPSCSTSTPGAPVCADPDNILRYFHAPHSHAVDHSGTHVACASCNPHGLPTSKPNSRLSRFPSNYISTTQYTMWNFLPRNLFHQFCKKANAYFLIIAILSFTPISPKNPLPAVAPLIFVLAVTAVKEALEDYKRHRVDVQVNASLVSAWRLDHWHDVQWADVRCGDILRILSEQFFPADMVLLQTSNQQGACAIETANLDGETNLKVKQAVSASYELECAEDGLDYPAKFQAVLQSDSPNDKMDQTSWNGNFLHFVSQTGEVLPEVPLGFNQLLLRGCRLRNTKWAIGMVCFTGRETKLMLQARSKEVKRSNMDRAVDSCLYIIFVFQACVCIAGAVGQAYWLRGEGGSLWFLRWDEDLSIPTYALLSYFTYLVLMDILVPISLYVSMELVKFGQAAFISVDTQMRHVNVSDSGEEIVVSACARTSNLNEELGQVSFIFSDKTGTLTRNEMKFLRATIGPKEYGPGCMADAGQVVAMQPRAEGIPAIQEDSYIFEDNRVLADLENKDPQHAAHAKNVDEFLTLLSLCHTVMLSYDDCDSNHCHNRVGCPARCRFNAQSPDELALVEFAQTQQYFFHQIEPAKFSFRGRTIQGHRLTVNIRGEQHDFDVFEVLEFDSTRKRCSVVLFDHRDEKIKIYCKGADNVIRERLSPDSLASSWLVTNAHLQRFASIGLRTLCCASREVSEDEFVAWYDAMQVAKSSMDNRAEAIANASEIIEVGFTLLGATAIEDRLQEGVPETIASLAEAGIRIWVLTGDKVETAINIGRSCNLLTDAMSGDNLMVIDIDEALPDDEAMEQTLDALTAAERNLARPDLDLEQVGIVVSGKALGFIFPRRKLNVRNQEIIPPAHVLAQEAVLQQRFLAICTLCKAVVCCRMSPKQKMQVVRLVKDNLKDKITLAVGDGANDVPMIEAAHLGIGIEGLEGKQATMASDVSLGQFRFLKRLLLVHGAWSYRRLGMLILYCFYKNVTISLVMLWFAIFSGFSGQIFYDQISASFYNILFTGLPVLIVALFNRDISEQTLLDYPRLYCAGQRNECFNLKLFVLTLFKGVGDSLLLFFFVVLTLRTCGSESGLENDHWAMSTALFTIGVLIVNLKIALETSSWTLWNFIGIIATVATWFVYIFIFTSDPAFNANLYGVMMVLVQQPQFWLLMPLLPVTCMLPEIAIRYVLSTYYPDSRAMGTLYIDYLASMRARDQRAKAEQQQLAEEFVAHTEQRTRRETAYALTQSLRSNDAKDRISMLQQAASQTTDAFGSEIENTPDFGAGDPTSLYPSLAVTTPTAVASTAPHSAFLGRHTVGSAADGFGSSGAEASGFRADDPRFAHLHARPRSLSAGRARAGSYKPSTWKEIAKTIKQDNVGFAPFQSSTGDADFVMSSARFRQLSMHQPAPGRQRNISLDQKHSHHHQCEPDKQA